MKQLLTICLECVVAHIEGVSSLEGIPDGFIQVLLSKSIEADTLSDNVFERAFLPCPALIHFLDLSGIVLVQR